MMNSRLRAELVRLLVGDVGWTVESPYLPNGREMRGYLVAALVGAAPCLAAATWSMGARVPAAVCVAFLSFAAVETAFGLVRKKPIGGGALVFGVLLALLLPPATPMWMVATGAAFGAVFGKECFGGTGRHVFNPVLAGKAFLVFSYPAALAGHGFAAAPGNGGMAGLPVWPALILFGALALCVHRPSNALVIAGILSAGTAVSYGMWALGKLPLDAPRHILLVNGFMYGACLLACDPATCPGTHAGRLLYGFVIGSLAVVIHCLSNYGEGMMCAILIANAFAPAINMMGGRGLFPGKSGIRKQVVER